MEIKTPQTLVNQVQQQMADLNSVNCNPEIQQQLEDLKSIRKEFEVYKAELNFLKAKKLKMETLMRRDQIEIAS